MTARWGNLILFCGNRKTRPSTFTHPLLLNFSSFWLVPLKNTISLVCWGTKRTECLVEVGTSCRPSSLMLLLCHEVVFLPGCRRQPVEKDGPQRGCVPVYTYRCNLSGSWPAQNQACIRRRRCPLGPPCRGDYSRDSYSCSSAPLQNSSMQSVTRGGTQTCQPGSPSASYFKRICH